MSLKYLDVLAELGVRDQRHVRREHPAMHPPPSANMAHIRQSRPDSGRGFQSKVLETFRVVPSLLRSGGGNVRANPPHGGLRGHVRREHAAAQGTT